MSLLKKLLSSNLTKYEEEQKRRYKKYVKIKKQEAKVIEKTEAELYEDSLERQKSLRASGGRASIKREEIIFKEPNSGLILGPAPAILEAINKYVIVDRIPEVYLEEVVLNYIIPKKTKKSKDKAVTHQEVQNNHDTPNVIFPPVPKRKKSKRSISHRDSIDETEFYEIKHEENRIITPNQDVVHKQQAVEIGRISISTTNSELFYDCINPLDYYEDIHSEINRNNVEDNINTLDITKVPKEFEDDEDVFSKEETISHPDQKFTKELIFSDVKTPFLHSSSLTEEINNTWENIPNSHFKEEIINQKWMPETTIHKEYKQLTLIEEPTWKPIQEIHVFEPKLNTPDENDIGIEEYLHDDPFISSDNEDDDSLNQCFNDYAIIEPTVIPPSFQVSKEKTKFDILSNNTYGKVEEEVILDEKIYEQETHNGRYGSSSSEDDVFEKKTNRKVNFDFGNSYCTTYEPVSQPPSSNETSLSSTTTDEDNDRLQYFSTSSYQIYLDAPPAYRDATTSRDDDMYNQKDSVYKNFQVSLEHIQKKHSERIYENTQGMDLALLNCKNGYKETVTTEDEEVDEFSESESIDFDINRDQKFQNYYDHIGDFKSDTGEEEIQRKYSISEIQDDLMEIKKLDDVVTQIDRIQDVMHKIHLQIDDLESKDDENYTPLLKTLLNSMKILGNLNCNFDEELLKFQQDTMEQITECIKSLKEL